MEPIQLQDGTTVNGEINGIDLTGTTGYALLVPTDEGMSLAERLAASSEIQIKRVNGVWSEQTAHE